MANDPSTLDATARTGLDRCREYLVYQLADRKRGPLKARQPLAGPAVTIDYQTGAGAHEIARRLAEMLQAVEPEGSSPWTVFDRQLVAKVLEEHHLPTRLARLLPEERRFFIRDVMEELVGLRPPSWVVEPLIAESILHLADAGHVILVGRGASVITARMPSVFHVRLIASLAGRTQRVQQLEHLSAAEAARLIARSDRGRGRYVRTYFHSRVDDDLQYHLVVNTDRIALPQAAELIAQGAREASQGCHEPNTLLKDVRYGFLPTEVEGVDALVELALDMRWSWNHGADDLVARPIPRLAPVTIATLFDRASVMNAEDTASIYSHQPQPSVLTSWKKRQLGLPD